MKNNKANKKKKINRKILFLAIGILVAVSLIIFFILALKIIRPQSSIGIYSEFTEKFNFEKKTSYDSTIFMGNYDNMILKIKRMDDYTLEMSQQYILDKIFVINSLFREIHSPYPGELSNRIECPDEFKPEKKSNMPFDYYIIYSTERLNYGACSYDLIKYKSINYFLYCNKQNEFYHVELFIPFIQNISVYEDSVKNLKCLE